MLRIVPSETAPGILTLRLEGRIAGPWVDELTRSCQRALGDGARLVLDFGSVSFIDRAGLAFLARLAGNADKTVLFVNCSPFVAEQLKVGVS